jgi:hypothetical protein
MEIEIDLLKEIISGMVEDVKGRWKLLGQK